MGESLEAYFKKNLAAGATSAYISSCPKTKLKPTGTLKSNDKSKFSLSFLMLKSKPTPGPT